MAPQPSPFSRRASMGLLVLTFINLFNYIDRYLVSGLVESLKKSELNLTDAQAGLLMTAFVIVYMVVSPVFGYLGDRFNRTKLISFGVGLWSLATVLGGFAQSFISLFWSRALVGVGEGAYGTIAPAIIADYFPGRKRGRTFAFFFAAIPIGSALGYVLAGLFDHHFGWRSTFFLAGLPGIILTVLALRTLDPPRGLQEEGAPQIPNPVDASSYKNLFRNRRYLLTVFGYAAYTFALGGLAFWMPAFLERIRGLPKSEATIQFGLIVVITGFIGTFVGGWLGDYFLKWSKHAYLWLSGTATLMAVPFAYVSITSPTHGVFISAMVVAELLLFLSTGPVNSTLSNVVTPQTRAFAFAISNLLIHAFGDVPSPWLIGRISDASSLGRGLLIVPGALLVAGIIWIVAALLNDQPGQNIIRVDNVAHRTA